MPWHDSSRAMSKSAELASLQVTGPSLVGWDAATPVNETLDAAGNANPEERGFGVADPNAPARRLFDDPEVCELREFLRARNGLKGLEICAPHEVARAARIFHRDGFVVVSDLLNPAQLQRMRIASARVLREILAVDGQGRKYMTESFRLPHRYSYGTCSASRQMLHDPDWAALIDLPTATPILKEIFGTSDYLVGGAGGDLCLPGAVEYQHLHSDGRDLQRVTPARVEQARQLGVRWGGDRSPDDLNLYTQRQVMEFTSPVVTINFLMSDLTWENGPIRQIPGTHAMQQPPPAPGDEPEWMRTSTLVGALAGAGVFRDNRAWHGATPNVGKEVRAMPNVEYLAPWAENVPRTMPDVIWQRLSPHAQHICRAVHAEPGTWPAGAGSVSPLAVDRQRAAGKP